MKDFTRLALLLLVFSISSPLLADPITINFDALADSDIVTNQFTGLTFANATVLTAGISLNEFEFPPFSGSNVIFDDGGPMSILFSGPVSGFGGYFNYLTPVTIEAYDASNNLLGSVTSLFFSNLALSGDLGSSPNEFFQLTFSNISSIRISGDPGGSTFTLDDATYTPQVSAVPEPSSILLVLSGVAGLALRRKKLRSL